MIRLRGYTLSVLVLVLTAIAVAYAPVARATTDCTASMTNLNFAATTGAANVDATATATVTCTSSGLLLGGNIRVSMCLSINAGTDGGGNVNPRRMINGFGDPMQMQLYTDAARSLIWGSRTNATIPNPRLLTFDYTAPALFGSGSQTQTVTLHGRIPVQTGLAAGTYANRFTGGPDTSAEFRFSESGTLPASCTSGGTAGTTRTFPFTVNGSVPVFCQITAKPAPDLDFGNVPGLIAANVDNTTAIGLNCTGRTAWQVGLNNGLNASGSVRRMRNAAGQFVPYELYRDAARNLRWGNTLGSDTQTGTGTGLAVTLTTYGRVVAPQAVAAGSYSDTITITVTY